ncbi:MAG: hypothetical protein EOM59_13630 [Clostridia bacterium]|nr:hypothetical protein [Clostridia bacterium]
MCILYAIKLWLQHEGRFVFLFRPNFHVVVCAKGRIFHGTNRGSGKWRAEEIDAKAFARWLANAGK